MKPGRVTFHTFPSESDVRLEVVKHSDLRKRLSMQSHILSMLISLFVFKWVGMSKSENSGFKGNKSFLPSKLCATCGREMTWRKSWAKNWESVKYCSDACRRSKSPLVTPEVK